MSAIDTFNNWLQIIGKPMGLPDLRLNDDQACAFTYDDQVTVAIKLDLAEEKLLLSAALPDAVQDDKALESLIFRLQEKTGDTFTFQPARHSALVLCHALPMNQLDADSFFAALQVFLETCKSIWQEQVAVPTKEDAHNHELLKPSLRV